MRDPHELTQLAQLMARPMERYLKFRQVCDRYERGKNSKFSEVYLTVQGENVRERESRAYSHPDYLKYLEEWDRAEKERVKAEVEFKTLETSFAALQSALSFDRESMKRLG